MERLTEAIGSDLQQFARGGALHEYATAPDFDRYDTLVKRLDAAQLDEAIGWLDGVSSNVPCGYRSYIKLYLRKWSADKHFAQYQQSNLCISCFDDLGSLNPRQLCGKTYCPYK